MMCDMFKVYTCHSRDCADVQVAELWNRSVTRDYTLILITCLKAVSDFVIYCLPECSSVVQLQSTFQSFVRCESLLFLAKKIVHNHLAGSRNGSHAVSTLSGGRTLRTSKQVQLELLRPVGTQQNCTAHGDDIVQMVFMTGLSHQQMAAT